MIEAWKRPSGTSGGNRRYTDWVPAFSDLSLHPALIANVTALGYEEATPIQAEAIPLLLGGRDLIGQAGTGTGKTAAFALPLLHRLLSTEREDGTAARALILVPTRELAMQVAEAVHKYSKSTPLRVVPVYGGAPMDQQVRALRRGADVVVATPGRALDHLKRETLKLDALEVLVLDEADEMLDMGFADDLDTLLTATPSTRQTMLFAATMAPRLAKIAETHLTKPARVTIKADKPAAGDVPRVRQTAYLVSRQQKAFALNRLLEFESPTSTIIFCRTRLEVDELTDTLKSHGFAAQALHGGMEQRQRDRVMQLVREDKADVLVATDVAARGLDIEHISHVINYDIPTAPEVYVHRIGRTGRAGREGVAITLVDPRERRTLAFIESSTRQTIERAELPTLAALKARRLEETRASLQERIVAGGLDEMKAFVASLGEDFDPVDIAAAALTLLEKADGGSDSRSADVREFRGADAPKPRRSDAAEPRASRARDFGGPETRAPYEKPRGAERPMSRAGDSPRPRRDTGPKTTLAFSVGEQDGVGPGDMVGAIAGESGIDSRAIGAIRINPTYSTVEVDADLTDTVIEKMTGKKIRGTAVDIKVMPAGAGADDDRPRSRPRPAGGPGKPGGFRKDGFKKPGFKREGFKREGFKREGFKREGFKREGFKKGTGGFKKR